MGAAKVSAPIVRKVDKPFRRIERFQNSFLVAGIYTIGIGMYWQYYGREFRELCFPHTVGLSIFFILRIWWVLKELLIHRKNVSHTIRLATQPSSTSNGNQYYFWLQLIFLVFGVTQLPPLENWFDKKCDILICLFTIVSGINLQWYDCALLESYRLEKPSSYSGGSAMAYSFYYGYLKLIAPGLVKRMEVFQANENISDQQIPHKKLFILIPSSAFVFDKLEGYQKCTKTKDLKIEHVGEKLESHKQDRGLVKGRTYKNTMYIVEYSPNEMYYILLEGATPIKTFYETCKEHNEFERNKVEVISSFYRTLRKLIKENKEMKDVVKLVYYDGFVTRIAQFRNEKTIRDEQIPEKKLFVLVPSSSLVVGVPIEDKNFSKTGDLTIKAVEEEMMKTGGRTGRSEQEEEDKKEQKFLDHYQDRGLIKSRPYRVTIYKVEYDNKEYYVMLKDTPLETFYEICREHKKFKDLKKEIISSFYFTLKQLIEDDPMLKDIVKLIYYDDDNNKSLKIPEVVKERIVKKVKKNKVKRSSVRNSETGGK